MESDNFSHAEQYDALYAYKDYAGEVQVLIEAFHRFGMGSTYRILDLGCGTGGHSIELAKAGFGVTGVDLSDDMLGLAMAKVGGHESVRFLRGDVRKLNLDDTYDAVVMMFAVLGYQATNEDVMATLENAWLHLRLNGLLIFDVWHGPAVLAQRPSYRLTYGSVPGGFLARSGQGKLDINQHLCVVDYRVWEVRGPNIASDRREQHTVRYFFPQEIKLFLANSGFELLSMSAFPSLDEPLTEDTWNALYVARAV